MSCIKIRLKNILPVVPNHFLDEDGYPTLDLGPDAEITNFKILSQLTDTNEISFDHVLSLDIPGASPKNQFLLSEYFHGKISYTPVQIWNGSFWWEYFMRVLEADANLITCEYITYDYYWARNLSNKKLNQLDIGELSLNNYRRNMNIVGSTLHPMAYNPTDPSSTIDVYPLVDYGDLRDITDAYIDKYGTYLGPDGYEQYACLPPTDEYRVEFDGHIQRRIGLNGCDFRPWFYAYGFIRRMFADEGYQVVSPILESEYGRRIITYNLDPKMSTERLEPTRIRTLKSTTAFTGQELTTTFGRQANGGYANYTRTLITYEGVGVYDIKIKVNYRALFVDKAQATIYVYLKDGGTIIKSLSSGLLTGGEDISDFQDAAGTGDLVNSFEADLSDVKLKEGQSISVELNGLNCTVVCINEYDTDSGNIFCKDDRNFTKQRSYLEATQKHKFYWRGDNPLQQPATIVGNSVLDREITQWDYFKGIAHLLNLKIYTDYVNKKVYLLQPDDINLYGAALEGFFQESPLIDVVKDTHKVINQIPIKEVVVRFTENDLHSRIIPIAEEGETVELENPIFQATYLQQYGGGSAAIETEGQLYTSDYALAYDTGESIYLPNVSGTLDIPSESSELYAVFGSSNANCYRRKAESNMREVLFDISPRVLLYYGGRKQPSQLTLPMASAKIGLLDQWKPISVFPLAGHYFPRISVAINPSDDLDPLTTEMIRPVESLYFRFDQEFTDRTGADPRIDFYDTTLPDVSLGWLYHNFVTNYYTQPTLQYLVQDTASDFFRRTLREKSKIHHLGKPYNVITKSIEDFKSCRKLPTLYNLLPYSDKFRPQCKQIYNPTLDPRSDYCIRNNNPTLAVDYGIEGDEVLIYLSGLNTDPVTGVTFEFSTDGETWEEAVNTSPITASFLNPGGTIYLRATVGYETCAETKTGVIYYNACQQQPVPTLTVTKTYVDGVPCFNTEIESDNPYTVILFTADIGDGPYEYTVGTQICNVPNVVFRLEVNTSENCENQVITIDVNAEQRCPTAEDLGLICSDPVGMFERTGNLNYDHLEDLIYYQTSEDGETWIDNWIKWDDESPITALYVRARRLIKFCGECPDVCTPIIYCTNCPEYVIGCIDCDITVEGDLDDCTVTWIGPLGFTAEGPTITVEADGTYIATIDCGICVSNLSYDFINPNTGTAIEIPVIS